MCEKEISTGKKNLGYPIICKWVPANNLQRHAEDILDYCDTLNEPLFVERDGKLDVVILSKEYYMACGLNEIKPWPSDDEITAALAESESGDE